MVRISHPLTEEALQKLCEYAVKNQISLQQIIDHALEEWALNSAITWPD